MISISSERKAQLDAYAQRHVQDATAALDDVLEEYFARKAEDFEETVASLREGFEDIKAGRTRPSEEVFE